MPAHLPDTSSRSPCTGPDYARFGSFPPFRSQNTDRVLIPYNERAPGPVTPHRSATDEHHRLPCRASDLPLYWPLSEQLFPIPADRCEIGQDPDPHRYAGEP